MTEEIIMVAGASGQLGRAASDILAARSGHRLILGSRSVERLNDLRDRVREVRRIDFDDAASLESGFAGVDRLLLISTNDLATGRRAEQHKAAIDAAAAAGVGHIVYTSITRPEPGALLCLAPEHFATERLLIDSSLGWTILRNNCYLDFALMGILSALGRGVIESAAPNGAIGFVSRADCAIAAAAALESQGRENRMYDITGPKAVTMTEVAALVSKITGKPLAVRAVTPEDVRTAMTQVGLPPVLVELIVTTDLAAARGHLAAACKDFEVLTGQSPKSAQDFLERHAPMLIGAAMANQAG